MTLRLLPRSLANRVFALYALALAVFVFAGLGLHYRYQFTLEIEGAQQRAESLAQVIAPTVSDSAVIGDYDTIQRTLERAIYHSDFSTAAFIDAKGTAVRSARQDAPEVHPPAWLVTLIAERLYDANLPISAGGRDYGMLRLSFASERVAGSLWRQARFALLLGLAALAGGLLALRWPLRRWLGDFERLQGFESALAGGAIGAPGHPLGRDAPTELKTTFDVLNRVAASAQAQREQAAVTLAAIGDAVLTLDAEGRVVLSNPAARQVLGRDEAALRDSSVPALLPGLFGGPGVPGASGWRGRRVRITAPDGRERVLDTTLSPVAGPDGAHSGHVLACRDVSDQHALEERIKRELAAREAAMAAMRRVLEAIVPNVQRPAGSDDIEALSALVGNLAAAMRERGEQLGAIFELSPDGFVSFDAAHTVSYVSAAFSRLTGVAPDEVLGLDEAGFAARLTPLCAGPGLDFAALRAAAARPGERLTLELLRPARRVLQVALCQAEGGMVSQVLLLRDITHETEVDQMKSEFLATAAHELRTPMASIFGFTELMLMRPMSPERQRHTLETVHRQTGLMINIVNELLDLARIEARRGKDFHIELLDLGALLDAVVRDFRPSEGREPPRLAGGADGLRVRGDRLKLTQAINNVLSNAYKYSPGGGAVDMSLLAPASAGGPLRVQVRDRGIGMTAQQLARVGERFWRADDSGAIAGTGLGMAIVKEIAGLHGGSLAFDSVPGEGTTVTLALPVA